MLLIELGNLADAEGKSWASHKYLADKCECSRKTIQRSFARLEYKGYIRVRRRATAGLKLTNLVNLVDEPICLIHETEGPDYLDTVAQGDKDTESYKTPTLSTHPSTHPMDMKTLFDYFWSVYPRKQGKQRAEKAFGTLAPNEQLIDVMSSDIKKRLNSGEWSTCRDQMKYIPHPNTYLNQRRWEDEVLPPKLAPHKNTQHPSPAGRTRDRSIEEDLADRSWAN